MISDCVLKSETIDLLSEVLICINTFVLTNQKQMWCDWQPSDYKNRLRATSKWCGRTKLCHLEIITTSACRV